jgi:L-rhamnose mutarotase
MIRKIFIMSVNPGQETEHERRHQPIWDDLAATLREHGVRHYTIHIDESSHQLIAVADIEDEAKWAAIAATEVCQRWWRYMSEIMPSNPDHSPIARELREVFCLGESVS